MAAAEAKLKIADNLKRVAAELQEKAYLASNEAVSIMLTGLVLLLVVKLLEGFLANSSYEKQYLKWRANPSVASGVSRANTWFGAFLLIAIWPLTLFRFTVADPDSKLSALTGGFIGDKITITQFPVGREYFAALANKGDAINNDWYQSNHLDVTIDGGHRITYRC